ncbi:hypothetical protein J6590_098739 [Homalodisca vitripennis]|nr:hypothetical protein J6590_098739 [Homalodisca vitripennis]
MHIAKDTLQLLRLFSVIIEHNGAVLKLAPAKKCRYGIKTIRIIFLPGEIRTSNLTFDPGTDGLKVISEQPPKAVQTGCSQGQDRSKVTHPSSSHARRPQQALLALFSTVFLFFVRKLNNETNSVILAGDLNADILVQSHDSALFLDFLHGHSLLPTVRGITSGGSCLDNIFTNLPPKDFSSGITSTCLSDHEDDECRPLSPYLAHASVLVYRFVTFNIFPGISFLMRSNCLPLHFKQQKPMCHSNLGNLMDVQERHIANRKCRDSGVLGQFDRSIRSLTSEVLVSLNIRVCHPVPAFTGEAGSELASPSLGGICIKINALNSSSWFSI